MEQVREGGKVIGSRPQTFHDPDDGRQWIRQLHHDETGGEKTSINYRNVIPERVFGAVLVGASGAAQVLAGMDDSLVWQGILMTITGGLGGYGAWLAAAESSKKSKNRHSFG